MRRGVQVRIPSGVEEDSVLRLAGMGDAGKFGADAGDMYVKFKVGRHVLWVLRTVAVGAVGAMGHAACYAYTLCCTCAVH